MKKHGNSNEDLTNLYSSSTNQFSDCNRLTSNPDLECTAQGSERHTSVSTVQSSMHKISSKPSVSNQRILEDLSQSKSCIPLFEASSTSKISARSSSGDLFTTEWIVRKRAERGSLWKIIIIEADGRWLAYCLFKHLKWEAKKLL